MKEKYVQLAKVIVLQKVYFLFIIIFDLLVRFVIQELVLYNTVQEIGNTYLKNGL
jgi:hypothetical protein